MTASKPTPVALVRRDGSTSESHGPARGHSWEPFGKGNQVARKHGAYAAILAERLDAKLAEVYTALSSDAPVREVDGSLPAADVPAVRLLADTLCRLDSIGEYLLERGWEGEDGKPRPVLEYEARLRGHALDLMRELGMTPASRAKLGLDLARTKRTLEDEIEAHVAEIVAGRETNAREPV